MPYRYPEKSILLALPGLCGDYYMDVGKTAYAPSFTIRPDEGGIVVSILKRGLYSGELEHRERRHASRGRPHLLTRFDLALPVLEATSMALSPELRTTESWQDFKAQVAEAHEQLVDDDALPSARESYGASLGTLPMPTDAELDDILDDPRFGPPHPPEWIVEEVGQLAAEQAAGASRRSKREFLSELWMVVCCAADAWLSDANTRTELASAMDISAEAFHRWNAPTASKRLLVTADELRTATTPHFIPLIRRAFVRLVDMEALWARAS